uniref:Large ribosomal subunit protein uL29 n=1 Tax=candidate division WOR-3 bacterium TaxID=2052148 RepID=A0A7V0Z4M7_UNCW3
MKVYELREKSREELIEMLNGLYRELFNLRMRHASQQLPNPLRLRIIKRDIARIRTILREDELGKRKLIQAKQVQTKTKAKKGE